ncbi:hypothetical protein GQ43DRAFT_432554 [Delitschia confertaspora ATCC 74209]|uniref:RGS domain-containing protein n=1 Tax=Delitschia confertaspora ATCC 74209 TaxID=1513339 RepID=A0A9P4JP06_9PLEO|nr:hypothetical protein GQ43DRAFT_432554 [Delitschia confertaspora ATCC 74209]
MVQLTVTPLGWTYIGLSAVWTCILLGGMYFLYSYRHLPNLQIRRLPLVFTAICSLHAYGVLVMCCYTIMPALPCNAEFWIMSIYLPFGIALFATANSQFLHIATLQEKFVEASDLKYGMLMEHLRVVAPPTSRSERIWRKIWRRNDIDRQMLFTGIGLFAQFALVLFVFLGSRKFHPGYGIFESDLGGAGVDRRDQCTKGWEWWLSIVWQFFWSWIYAPYILWKSRRIHDVNGWRVQTICCCLAGLPASPLWLAGLYIPQMEVVNKVIIPPQWFAVSIFFIEIFTIFFPCWQAVKSHSLRKETLDELANWEKKNQILNRASRIDSEETLSYGSTKYSGSTLKSADTSNEARSVDSRNTDMFTMVALETALKINPDPLLRFAALKDFSGENVSFLINVANWKLEWSNASKELSSAEHRRQKFTEAVRIYASFVSMDFSEFPINLSCQEARHLHDMFETAAVTMCRNTVTSNSATPFDLPISETSSTTDFRTGLNLHTLGKANLQSVRKMADLDNGEQALDAEIPATFGADVFSTAEHEIRYLVFTNTWPKFVNEGYNRNAGKSVMQRFLCYLRPV